MSKDSPEKAPLISVLMSVHNGMPWLRESVESILRQTLDEFEFLIVDDASSDDSPEYLRSLTDPRVRVIKLQENIGLTAALNRGLAEARGEFIARQDSDDISGPERFFLQAAHLKLNPTCAAVGSQLQLIDHGGRVFGTKRLPLHNDAIRFLHLFDNALAHSAVMFRTKVARNLGGYNETFAVSQDYDLWSRMSESHALGNLPQKLLQLRVLETSITRKHSRPDLIEKVQREHFARLFARQPSDEEMRLISRFRSRVESQELEAFRCLLADLATNYTRARSISGDFARMLALMHERIGYNLLTVSRAAAWSELAGAIRQWPGVIFSVPWWKVCALTVLGDRARQLYSKAVK